MKNYKLVDARRRAEKNPDTFEVPTEDSIEALKVGDYVKLIFLVSPGELIEAERMWVKIKKIERTQGGPF